MSDQCAFLGFFWDYLLGPFYLGILLWIPILIFLGKELTMGICNNKIKLHGKVAIVTGANSGIGYETAKELAKRGARVYLGCRNQSKGEDAIRRMKQSVHNHVDVRLILLDLSSLKSVKKFADDFRAQEEKLDILVNNAGTGAGYLIGQDEKSGRKLTKDGLEVTMQSNHFGHFLLTNLLHDLLVAAGSSRVVNCCSDSHYYVNLELDNMNSEKDFVPDNVYGMTKLANLMFTKEIAHRWGSQGIQSYAPHPGWVRTNFFESAPPTTRVLIDLLWWLMGKNCEQGAQTQIYCCTQEGLTNGGFFMDCMELTRFYHRAADDKDLRDKFWNKSAEFVQL